MTNDTERVTIAIKVVILTSFYRVFWITSRRPKGRKRAAGGNAKGAEKAGAVRLLSEQEKQDDCGRIEDFDTSFKNTRT